MEADFQFVCKPLGLPVFAIVEVMEPHAVRKAKPVFEPLQDPGPETAHTKHVKREMNAKLMAFLTL